MRLSGWERCGPADLPGNSVHATVAANRPLHAIEQPLRVVRGEHGDAITGQGPYQVKLGRGSGPEGPVDPMSFKLVLPTGVSLPLHVDQVILFERVVAPRYPGVRLDYRISDNGDLLVATHSSGALATLGPVIEREKAPAPGYAGQTTNRVDVTIEGRTAQLLPGQWRKLETDSGVFLLRGHGSSWGPGTRPADAGDNLSVSILRQPE